MSLLVGVNKPAGLTSHDVVNRCRRIFGERRVGHAGTLDPMATGVMLVCVGPATRLDAYLTSEYKSYDAKIAFGFETTTDDAEGEPTVCDPVLPEVFNSGFADDCVKRLVGFHDQVPPQYSAIKVNGQKAYARARSGKTTELEARRIEVSSASLLGVSADEQGNPCWNVSLSVSKGTYIRAIARDLGRAIGCPAHLSSLCRTSSGAVTLEECISLESLESLKEQAALDPVRALGMRFAFADEYARYIESGNALEEAALELFDPLLPGSTLDTCACTSDLVPSYARPHEGERVCLIIKNRLKAIYEFQASRGIWKPACVFATAVYRG